MNNISILIVDDNPAIHIDFKKILENNHDQARALEDTQAALLGEAPEQAEFNFMVDSAYQGDEALRLVRKNLVNNQRYVLAFIDVRMPPGMDGVETARQICELDSDIQIVICTAYTDYSWEDLIGRLGIMDRLLILKKPFENIEVWQLANSLSKKWQMGQQLYLSLRNLETLVEDRTAKLENSLSLVRATLESTTNGILVVDAKQRIIDYNQKCLQILHVHQDVASGGDDRLARKIVMDQLRNPEQFNIKAKEAYKHPDLELHGILNFKDGRIIEYFSTPHRVFNTIIGRVFSFSDITEQKKIEEQLIQRATHDDLTGLPNRIVLYDRIQHAFTSAKRSGNLVVVLFIDLLGAHRLDRFCSA